MLNLRRGAVFGVKAIAKQQRVAIQVVPQRFNSTSFASKERSEETIYFQKEDERLKHELKMKMEKIMSLEDGHVEKKELIDLLTKKEVADPNQGFLSKLGLDDWKVAAPIGFLCAIPALSNEVITLGPEAELAVCFALFVGTLVKNIGPMTSKFFKDYQDNVINDLKKVDENLLLEVNASIDSTNKLLTLDEELKSIQHLRDDLAVVQADVLNHIEQHKFRDAVSKKLDSLVAIEEAASVAIRTRMITKVKSDVVSSFTNDAKAKEKALDAALAILAAGSGAKRGKDVVGEAFVKSIGAYRETYSKTKPSEDPIIVQFEKDIQAAAAAPVLSYTASNVYESHPLQGAKASGH